MALDTYRRKRDFTRTGEPAGERAQAEGHRFVVQKHDARRLHYDFRLELDGVLKSWAVTKGPSLVPGEKRLAVHVEDHPLDYGDFEGTIPQGQYGGGTVSLWDRGTWTPLEDAEKGLAKGHLDFELHGEKLTGRWHLVRMKARPREKRDNWLLIKGDDDAARDADDPDILEEQPDSVKTGRTLAQIAGGAPSIEGAKAGNLPAFVAPALATLVATPPSGPRWIHEIKFDGYRLEARIADGAVRLLTRSGLDWTAKFGSAIRDALAALPVETALIDGELVVEIRSGASDFSALQTDLSDGRTDRFLFYAFDLLYLDGKDLRASPLRDRKAALRRILPETPGILRLSADFADDGARVLDHACRLGLEGIVSKQADSPYRSGRGKIWVKAKCSARQEFVIGGYVPSTTGRRSIGSLVLGVHDAQGLRYVGRVGTGFSAHVARDLFGALEAIGTPKSPFADRLSADEARAVHYVRPERVAEVEFRAWTADGRLRHAAFRGIRDDKPAAEIVREMPVPETPPTRSAPARKRTIALTHPDRIYWPDAGVTKQGLAEYYTAIWPHIAPFIVDRPLALLRCPEGIAGPRFFQKNVWKGMNAHIRALDDPAGDAEEHLIGIHDLDGLMGLVQSAALEIHPWGASCRDWEKPDQLVMDLDPGEDVAWERVIDAARQVRARLEASGLTPFVKTSGGKGLHVVAPLKPEADWETVKSFSKTLAQTMAADRPDRFIATITKAKRHGKILLDYLRNQRGATSVAPYSTRARPGAPVSMPLAWDELGAIVGSAQFTVGNAMARLASLRTDPWEGFHAARCPVPSPSAPISGSP
ncbi:DNA ligase D [Gluconacetobacter takamatsuzukensis]|uniref:DNA ligase (ATP) n=1 Tax=Gluconacetobacter takamatsuzukensis TaxID=1286190 RepID=A0A7W4KGL3_9PROT|nr:DNA ligase D [Gluconacetobacter takamatsuzukensis]MBB2206592.1 DNA ligase D [Gluconacetobacter takamatsuzukensis]